jgi:hypothetical protein
MSHCKLRTPRPIHFKLRIVIGIDSLMVCILFGESWTLVYHNTSRLKDGRIKTTEMFICEKISTTSGNLLPNHTLTNGDIFLSVV